MIVRRPGWEARLASAMTAESGHPYAYGLRDCETLVASAVKAMCGEHPWPWAKGYRSALQGYRLLRKQGLKNVTDMLSRAAVDHGWIDIDQKFMTVGDVFAASDGRIDVVGVCLSSGPVARCAAGLVIIKRDAITHAWRIP